MLVLPFFDELELELVAVLVNLRIVASFVWGSENEGEPQATDQGSLGIFREEDLCLVAFFNYLDALDSHALMFEGAGVLGSDHFVEMVFSEESVNADFTN